MGAAVPEKPMRKERSALPEPATSSVAEESEQSTRQKTKLRIRTFESDIDPFEISLLNSGQFVLYRKVWRDGQRYIQGALLERGKLLHDLIETPFQETGLSLMSDLILAYRDNVMSVFSNQAQESYLSRADELHGAVLLQTGLSAPFSDLELIFSVRQLPAGAGTPLIAWVSGVLLLVLCGGFYLIYRVAVQQIELVRQQQNFVSAVSHELKTPLTSIRMYGEILREGWASEEKKRIYYDYIHDESERLSRLIANVLQLARVNRNDLQINLRPIAVAHLMETVQAKILSQIERAGFALELNCDPQARRAMLVIEVDAFMQILINLVDNAIKFSAKSEKRQIELGCRLQRNATLVFIVRDHGPGVPREQMKKIFKLFYRSENELTRETLGTGIGLALVWQLTRSMNGWVEVVNQSPGAEFRLAFTALDDARE
jgi:signal transduction histidine kinase